MKCLEKLVLKAMDSIIPITTDPLQFAYRKNRSVNDTVALALHSAVEHLDTPNTYVRMLFLDYSSAFNTVLPTKLVAKLAGLRLPSSTCSWILNFLTERPQVVRVGNRVSTALTISTGTPQGCCLSPRLFTLYTNDCLSSHKTCHIYKFADDTSILGLIKGGDETNYRQQVDNILPPYKPCTSKVLWCSVLRA
ncbi:putative RNA-directed DNA polymerase from transposon BS [Merluccius polli]|uniref:RNA-directed DNA polymerase from transposon BS n=1 Tax=Merluccius polli TaxID=89951 RepID=A0AA47MS34_MERPO|nr:putative RNA-directed DNA polymerase from transposon BS [Merluccius polli]